MQKIDIYKSWRKKKITENIGESVYRQKKHLNKIGVMTPSEERRDALVFN
jgi:hypothetical protein